MVGTSTKMRAEKVYDMVEAADGKYVKAKDISEKLGVSVKVIGDAAKYAMKMYPDLRSKPGCGYFVVTNKKNQEGYPDPTAAAALANIMMSNGVKPEPYQPRTVIYEELFKPGVVFQVLLGRSYVRMYVAAVSGPYLYTLALNEKGDGINPTRLFSIDARKANVEGEVTNGTEIMADAARKAVLDLFGFTPTVEVTESNLEYELLKQRADIYEKCFYAVCGKEVQS